jgi:hypothetical protein
MDEKEFEEKAGSIRANVFDCYGTIDRGQQGMAGMMDMLIESILLLAETNIKGGE